MLAHSLRAAITSPLWGTISPQKRMFEALPAWRKLSKQRCGHFSRYVLCKRSRAYRAGQILQKNELDSQGRGITANDDTCYELGRVLSGKASSNLGDPCTGHVRDVHGWSRSPAHPSLCRRAARLIATEPCPLLSGQAPLLQHRHETRASMPGWPSRRPPQHGIHYRIPIAYYRRPIAHFCHNLTTLGFNTFICGIGDRCGVDTARQRDVLRRSAPAFCSAWR